MATKFCPQCHDEFVASVTTCPDCEVDLVDEQPEGVDDSQTGQKRYELHEWAVESRVMLESLLSGQALPHVWEGTDLLVPAALTAKVDGLIQQVEITAEPNLDPDAPKIAYDLADWTDEQQTTLVQELDRRGIPYDFEVDGSLIVLEEDDPKVEAALDDLDLGDEDEDEDADDDVEGDGELTAAAVVTGADDEDDEDEDEDDDLLDDVDAQEVMSNLFVASDRLYKKPADSEGILTVVENADVAERMRLPYGFNRRDWQAIVALAGKLRDLIEDDESADGDIMDAATGLRTALRPFV